MSWNIATNRTDTKEPLHAVAFSKTVEGILNPNGGRTTSDYIAYGGESNEVYIIRTSDWGLDATLSDPNDTITSLSWSPDGRFLLVGSADSNVYEYITKPYGGSWNLNVTITDSNYRIESVEYSDADFIHGSTHNKVTGNSIGELRNYLVGGDTLTQTLDTGSWEIYDISITRRGYGGYKYMWTADTDGIDRYKYDENNDEWSENYSSFYGDEVECIDTMYVLQTVHFNPEGMVLGAYNDDTSDGQQGLLRATWDDYDFDEFDSSYDAGWSGGFVRDAKISWDTRFVAWAHSSTIHVHNARGDEHSEVATLNDAAGPLTIDFSYNDNWLAVVEDEYNLNDSYLYVYNIPRKDLYIKAETGYGTKELNVKQMKNTFDDEDYPLRLQVDEKMCCAETINKGDAGDSGIRVQVDSDTSKAWKEH